MDTIAVLYLSDDASTPNSPPAVLYTALPVIFFVATPAMKTVFWLAAIPQLRGEAAQRGSIMQELQELKRQNQSTQAMLQRVLEKEPSVAMR